ncbi:MAG TPA: response regulator transcription factor [Symbiobacteriaceae bacterium]|jgi:two-component system NarL family response regulator
MSETMAPHRILVVDDHGVVRRGLVALLSDFPDFCVVAEAANGEAAIRLATQHVPDIVIMDVRMPGIGGIEACRRILEAAPRTGVVFLTSFPDEDALADAMLAGARGYVLKNLEDTNLVEAVRVVARGESFLDPSLGASVALAMRRLAGGGGAATKPPQHPAETPPAMVAAPPPATPPARRPPVPAQSDHGLTDLDLALLRLIAAGHTNREIADRLNFAEKTIRNYVSILLAKLHLHNRAEAAAYAVRCNLVDAQ